MIDFLIWHIGLKGRIYTGYFALAGLALLLALLAYGTLNRLESGVRDYSLFTDYSTENLTFTAQMSEMQRQSLIYIHEGHHAAGDRVGAIYVEMSEKLKQGLVLVGSKEKALLTSTKVHLDNYFQTFQEVRKQRDLQESLVRTRLRENANAVQRLIEELVQKTPDNLAHERLLYSQMFTSFLQIEKNAYRYFDSLDSENVNLAAESISETKNMINSIRDNEGFTSRALVEMETALNAYEVSFYEAVQRTRGYLFLVNVVMAAEAYETLYQTRVLSELVQEKAETTKSNVFSDIEATTARLILTSSILLLGIGLFSLVISRSITQPIKRLTNTFSSLSSGALDTNIPLYPQRDELGELTYAADCFKEKNIELHQNKQELERSNDELEQFVYTVSHDLKSPIVTSMGFIGIIQKLAKQGKFEQAIEKLDRVVKSNMRMSQLVNDLLELSRVGRTDLDKRVVDLNQLLAKFQDSQQERLKRAELKMEIEAGLPTIFANESRILQVFENLLSNALKYGISDTESRIHITGKTDEQSYLIAFSDNGQGIPEEYQEKIFGLFYRLDSNVEGTGIGLAVSKKVMLNHGGDIWVESMPGRGATFWLKFPKEQADIVAGLPEER